KNFGVEANLVSKQKLKGLFFFIFLFFFIKSIRLFMNRHAPIKKKMFVPPLFVQKKKKMIENGIELRAPNQSMFESRSKQYWKMFIYFYVLFIFEMRGIVKIWGEKKVWEKSSRKKGGKIMMGKNKLEKKRDKNDWKKINWKKKDSENDWKNGKKISEKFFFEKIEKNIKKEQCKKKRLKREKMKKKIKKRRKKQKGKGEKNGKREEEKAPQVIALKNEKKENVGVAKRQRRRKI
ncbi:hypothetical protein RFI_17150, partial [Reticulomyxa filosa]